MANVIITGSSRGIGFEMARIFAEDGHNVLALSRNMSPVANLNHKNIDYFSFDIEAPADLQKVMAFIAATWKQVDILINNAGKLLNTPFLETSSEAFEAVYKVNVFGVANLTKCVYT